MSIKISIIVTCYNYGKYLIETVDSIKAQTASSYEIIIVDDGSTESYTKDVLRKYEEEGIRVVWQENGGPSSARNSGISVANGQYIVPLDADDLLAPTFLERCSEVLDRDRDISIVYTDVELFGAATGLMKLPELSPATMLYRNSIVVTAMYRKEVWESLGGYNTEMRHGIEDWDFWIGCMDKKFKFYKIAERLFFYRIKKKSRNVQVQGDREKLNLSYRQMVNRYPHYFLENLPESVFELKATLEQYSNIRGLGLLMRINSFLRKIKFFE